MVEADLPDEGGPALVTPLDRSIDQLWETMSDRSGLMGELAADAVLVRADAGELAFCFPRLAELMVRNELGPEPAFGIADRLVAEGWQSWEQAHREAIEEFFDTWWLLTRVLDDGPLPAHEVLGVLVHLGLPLVRWLGPWLEDLDGPPARHFADMVMSQLHSPAWEAAPDERGQVLAWAASEPCVFGIALVGGIHLSEGQLSEVLDRLV